MDFSKNVVVLAHNASLATSASDDLTGTLRIKSDNVALYNIDVRNDFGVASTNGQAIAISAYGSKFGAYACRFFSYQVRKHFLIHIIFVKENTFHQDTLYANVGTQVYLKSYIEVVILFLSRMSHLRIDQGAVDFIFGREGQAYFEGNTIASKGAGCVTANGRQTNDSTMCAS